MFVTVAALTVTNNGQLPASEAQARTVRLFDSAGVFVDSWGRDGAGPSEFGALDAGLAELSDARVVVRDPGNARLQIFSAAGEPLDTWGVISGQWRSRELLFVRAAPLLTVHLLTLVQCHSQPLVGQPLVLIRAGFKQLRLTGASRQRQ